MYIIIEKKSNRVLYKDLTREQMQELVSLNMDFLEDSEYEDGITTAMKFNKKTNSFITMTMNEIRNIRQALLNESDWRATVDYPGADKDDWLEYRQKLRDLPQDYPDIIGLTFPSEPSGG